MYTGSLRTWLPWLSSVLLHRYLGCGSGRLACCVSLWSSGRVNATANLNEMTFWRTSFACPSPGGTYMYATASALDVVWRSVHRGRGFSTHPVCPNKPGGSPNTAVHLVIQTNTLSPAESCQQCTSVANKASSQHTRDPCTSLAFIDRRVRRNVVSQNLFQM